MDKVLKILAFAGVIGAGVFCVYFAMAYDQPVLYVWAAIAVFAGVTGFIFGTGGKPSAGIDPPKLGGTFTGLPDWLVLTDTGLVIFAVILSLVL